MTQTLVAADLDLAADVRGDLAAEVALELEVALEVVAEGDELGVVQVLHAEVRADAGRGQRLLGAGTADAVDVGERDLEPLLAGEVDADKTCHVPFGSLDFDRRSAAPSSRVVAGPGLRAGGSPCAGPGGPLTERRCACWP